ncbi:MAG: flippase-like domain-containing protein [Candidatus Heimdallarchaeota archaeon]|nr:flippase-like domain-containing protein [Candidatus Heimdallarchaeota archaeon]MCK4769976.1 flippase-like domain-containing protein [Candidatus Heimdallarchaeota archaeon]
MTKAKDSSKAIKIIRNLLAIFVTVSLIAFLIYRFKPKNIAEVIRTLDIWVIFVAILIMVIMFVIKIVRWLYILRKLDVKISFFQAIQLVLIGSFGAAVTPAKVGDVVRALYLSRWTNTKESTSFFSAILDRVTDLISVGIFSLVALPFFITQLNEKIKWVIAGGMLIIIVILLLMFNSQIIRRIIIIISKLRKRKSDSSEENEETEISEENLKSSPRVLRILDDYYSHLTYFTPSSYVIILSLSILFWALLGIQVSLLIVSMANITISVQVILTVTGIMALAAIVSLIPISISGIGIRDATITVLVFYSLAIGYEVAFGASIIQTAVNMLIPALIGGLILLIRKWKKRPNK